MEWTLEVVVVPVSWRSSPSEVNLRRSLTTKGVLSDMVLYIFLSVRFAGY